MGQWQTHTETWLSSEQNGLDDAADAAFAQLFTALPSVEPSAAFVQRAVDAAWLVRARRRRAAAWAGLAASAVMVAVVGAGAYGLFGTAGGWLLTTAASMVTASTLSVVMVGATGVEWWWAAARAAGAVTGVMVTPHGIAALMAIEFVAAAALHTLHRLLRAEVRFHST